MLRFRDRREAGRVLAERLSRYAGRDDAVVLALPRGGVPVGYEVARALAAPLDVVVAVPVAADETCEEFRGDVDHVVCAFTPEPFFAVGLWYEHFDQTTDDEVRELLREAVPA